MLTKFDDVIVQCLWRHSSQFKSQKCFTFFDVYLFPHFENSSATHA